MDVDVWFARPDIGMLELLAVELVMNSGLIARGEVARNLERRWAARVGAADAVALDSCTSAMILALEALGVGPGDEVIVPALTFAATANVVERRGARPVVVDVCPDDYLIDPVAVGEAMTERTRAIIPVHYAGQAPGVRWLESLRALGTKVVEDAAHQSPSVYRSGGTVCWSCYATKPVACGRGGVLTADDEDLVDRVKCLANHGLIRRHVDQEVEDLPGEERYLPEILAAIAFEQLGRDEEMTRRRVEIADRYDEALAELDGVDVLVHHDGRPHSHHLYVARFVTAHMSEGVADGLAEGGIETSRHFRPLHCHRYYQERYGYRPADYPVALDAWHRSLSLPIWPAMSDDQVELVVSALRVAVEEAAR